jgi:glucokinase
MFILGDIGGTKTRIASSSDLQSFNEPIIFETPKDYSEAIEKIKEILNELIQGDVEAVCFGISGILSKQKDSLVRSPHLPNWERQALKKDLQELTKCKKVFLENDTAIVGLGEATKGAGKGRKLIAYITISTGVGGAKIDNKHIDEKTYGFEPGHQLIHINHEMKSLEQLVSGSGIKEQTGLEASEVDDAEFWERVTKNIAIGLHNTILHWSPEMMVIGGGVVLSGKLSMEKISQEIQELLIVFPEIPEVVKSELGDLGGLYGGMEYIRDRLT